MKIKSGVNISGIEPEIVLALTIANDLIRYYENELVITSVLDGKHKEGSLHYIGDAVDIRSRNFTNNEHKLEFVRNLTISLGPQFDVILEGLNTDNEHIHIEFQPKR